MLHQICLASLVLLSAHAQTPAWNASRQMVVVTTSNWDATDGVLRRFEWRDGGWRQNGQDIPVVVGRSGLAWGRGLHPMPQDGPQKHEGDGKSPAGIFLLPYAFGYAAPGTEGPVKLPYVQCTGTSECVDDGNSSSYNKIVDRQAFRSADWHSSEKMRMSDDEYRLGVYVAHNSDPAVKGGGSCVFLHIWKRPGHPTSGCTAMSLDSIKTLLAWLDPQAQPVLVQLPADQYPRAQKLWRLPALRP
jgi:L,D-peptidoglycan transpeptidase YkuD (ErfK/YbiS/YcfS/YnhG family)